MKLKASEYKAYEILKIIREWTGLTQKEFGLLLNRTERSIQSLESGARHCTLDTLLQIANIHNVKIEISKPTIKSKKRRKKINNIKK